jgi:hypothetical protein
LKNGEELRLYNQAFLNPIALELYKKELNLFSGKGIMNVLILLLSGRATLDRCYFSLAVDATDGKQGFNSYLWYSS